MRSNISYVTSISPFDRGEYSAKKSELESVKRRYLWIDLMECLVVKNYTRTYIRFVCAKFRKVYVRIVHIVDYKLISCRDNCRLTKRRGTLL